MSLTILAARIVAQDDKDTHNFFHVDAQNTTWIFLYFIVLWPDGG